MDSARIYSKITEVIMLNLLFSNAGRRTYLIDFASLLKEQGLPINIFVSDTNYATASFYVRKNLNTLITPRISDGEQKYFETLYSLCKQNKIHAIIPLMDFELPILAKHSKDFLDIGCTVIVSTVDVIEKTLNKKKHFKFLTEKNILTPKSYFSFEEIPSQIEIIRKKILGSGSVGISFHKNKECLYDFEKNVDMVQEIIRGQEYGIDILNDLEGNFVHACVKRKISMRSGETDKAEVVYRNDLYDYAKKLSHLYKHIGNMDVDVIVDENNKIWCIDINPRFGGGYPFTHYAGFNYLEWIIKMLLKQTYIIPKEQKKITGMKGVSLYYYAHE